MADMDGADALEAQVDALESAFTGAAQMAAAFDSELMRMQSSLTVTQANVGQLSSQIGRGLRKAFDGLIFDGMRLSEALRTVAESMINATYNAAMKPITNHFGSLMLSLDAKELGYSALMQARLTHAASSAAALTRCAYLHISASSRGADPRLLTRCLPPLGRRW